MAAPDGLVSALSGSYRIERELGAGGMATVFLAEDLKHQRKVAVKVLRPELAATLGPERFLREVTIAANLQHPHVLPLYDSGQANGFLYYVMPFVEGTSLRQKVVREGELPVPEAVRLLRDVADAMAYAHQRGVVHRDIKPENVMLSGRHALVTDFGVAKAVSEATGRQTLTTAGVALGTPTYMAPEQAAADPHTDHRADIYAFGVMAYELLTGRPPFVGATPQSVLAAHVTMAAEPVTRYRASIPPALATLVMRCLEKKPADRWQSADELIPQLEAVLTPSGGITPAATQPVAALQAPGRSRVMRAGVAVVGFAALIGIGYAGARASGLLSATSDRSVAVLTFETIGRDTSALYLAEGLADGISASLSGVDRLTIVSRTAVRHMAAGTDLPPSELGQRLGAAHFVGGSIQRVGDHLRVTVELVRSRSGEQLWTEKYDAANADLLSVQTQIAQAVADNVAGRLFPSERTNLARRLTADPDAYDHYLRGNRLLWKDSEATVLGAIAEYEAALERDPAFASAMGRLAYAYGIALNWAYRPGGLPVDSVLARGLAAGNRAIEMDSTISDAWLGIGLALFFRGDDFGAALDAARRAVELDSSNDAAHHWYAVVLRRTGKFDQAEQEYHRAITINPERIQSLSDLGFVAFSKRSYGVAAQWYERSLAVDSTVASTWRFLGYSRALAGDATGGLLAAQRALSVGSEGERGRLLAGLAEAQARAGDQATARSTFAAALSELGASAGSLPAAIVVRNAWEVALAAAALGERSLALDVLERAQPRGPWLWSYLIFEGFDPIRNEPRFRRIIDEARPAGATDPR